MNVQQILKKQIDRFILQNPDNLTKEDLYTKIVEEFGVDRKTVSRYYLNLQKSGILKGYNNFPETKLTDSEVSKVMQQTGEDLTVSVKIDYEVKSLEDLLAVCDIDTTKWEVVSWQCKKWDIGIKNANNAIETKNLYSVSAKFKAVKLEEKPELQKQIILKELFNYKPQPIIHQIALIGADKPSKTNLLELALFDVHFGKLAHREESGEDYDIKIAAERYNNAIDSLLSRVNINSIERILFPIGNDLINIDNIFSTTTAGTKQDSDSRFYKIVRTVKELLIATINRLLAIAPVDVVVCVGNHDQQTSFMLGEMLEAYYHNVNDVSIDNNAAQRKYYRFGKTSFLFTHGNNEKHAALGMIFAAENPKLWAATTQRYIQLGHYHHNKKINYLANEEYQGFQIQIIPSLSGSDAWHSGKGYNSLKQAKAFLYNKAEGLIGEFTYTVQ